MKLYHLSTEYQEEIAGILRKADIVAWFLDDLRPANVPFKHRVKLTDDSPIYSMSRRLPLYQNGLVCSKINKILADIIIPRSQSVWSLPVVIAGKMDGGAQFCVD